MECVFATIQFIILAVAVVAQYDTGVSNLGLNDYEGNVNQPPSGKSSVGPLIDNSESRNNEASDNAGKLLSGDKNDFPIDSPYNNLGGGGSNLPVSRGTLTAPRQRSKALHRHNKVNIVPQMEKGDGFARKFKEGAADDESINQLLTSFEADDKSGNPNHLGKHGSFDFMNRNNETLENEFSS